MRPTFVFPLLGLTAMAGLAMLLCAADPAPAGSVKTVSKAEVPKLLQVPSPDWRDQVLYFIMPDRFNDGDPTNSDQKAGEFDPKDGRKYSGGDLAGITQKLDYIKGLGMTGIWITPPVANQWWDPRSQYGGYHGYWAENFMAVDKHMGSLDDYKLLSASLHKNGMYLIQDIVPNHTGNFFSFENPGNPDDPAKGLSFNTESVPVKKPSQKPFDQNDFTKKADRDAAVYHWTPSIRNFGSKTEMQQGQLSELDDINTESPLARQALRQSFGYWIKEVGVDGFRIDTVKYVPHDFWNDFHWNTEDKKFPGIMQVAKSVGKKDFVTFGEDWETVGPYLDKPDKTMASFLGTADNPELVSLVNFSLQSDIRDVFSAGRPTDQLAFRWKSLYKAFPDPTMLFNFIDNHDMDRFATAADLLGTQQALLYLFTVPGVPIIYYGTEQGFTETRASMFAAGIGSGGKDHFDTAAPLYQFIKSLSELRKTERELSHGKLQMLRDSSQAGILAYTMSWQGRTALMVFNTAASPMLMDNAQTGLPAGTRLERLTGLNDELSGASATLAGAKRHDSVTVGTNGLLNLVMPPRSALVLAANAGVAAPVAKTAPVAAAASADNAAISGAVDNAGKDAAGLPVFATNQTIGGKLPAGLKDPRLVINGNLDSALALSPAADGSWSLVLPATKLSNGLFSAFVQARDEAGKLWVSSPWRFRVELAYTAVANWVDPEGDDKGPSGKYRYPANTSFQRNNDIKQVEVATAGTNLQLRVTMAAPISNSWSPPNGFDHVAFYVYLGLPGQGAAGKGAVDMPFQQAKVPSGMAWNRMALFGGWANMLFSDLAAGPKAYGTPVSPSAAVAVDRAKNQVTLTFSGLSLGSPTSLSGTKIYLSTWDYDGLESANRRLSPEGADFVYGNGQADEPLVMDDIPVISVP